MALLKNYMAILKNPSGFKENLLLVIRDLDERIKELEVGSTLKQMFSPIDHTHDNRYAYKTHEHAEYSKINHTHGEYVRKNEDTAYNSDNLAGLPATMYAKVTHVHPFLLYIASFKVPTLSGKIYVQTEFDVEKEHTYLLETIPELTIDSTINNEVCVNYDFNDDTDKAGKTYHVVYWTEDIIDFDRKTNTKITMNDIIANRGETIQLDSTTTDNNNNPIETGEVEYVVFD